jgi:hypothetical protein
MTRYLPTLRGWIALSLAVLGCLFYPLLLPPRYVQSGGPSWYPEPVSSFALVVGGIAAVACFCACFEAFRRGSPVDRAVAVIAILFAIGLLTEVLGARSVPVRPVPNHAASGNGAMASLFQIERPGRAVPELPR